MFDIVNSLTLDKQPCPKLFNRLVGRDSVEMCTCTNLGLCNRHKDFKVSIHFYFTLFENIQECLWLKNSLCVLISDKT